VIEILNGWAGERRQARARAREAAERACALDASDPDAHHVLGALATECGQLEAAVECFELAIEIDPSHVHALSGLGQALAGLGRCEEGAAAVERAIRLSPRDPLLPHFLADLAVAHFGAGRFELSARCLERSRRLATLSPGNHAVLVASYAWLGRPEASVEVAALRSRFPLLTLDVAARVARRLNPAGSDRLIEGLRMATLE
jgi:tetratricopeptide (TPR) repeat protein